jgi:NAD(P)-dependent dehydrogenase (short-subunit alcohol dehydrogenase family)/aryl carrier-like protein
MTRAHALAERTLAELQEWLSTGSGRLVVHTDGAVAAGRDDVTDIAAATVWGLVRSAQLEYPDRDLILVDAPPGAALGEAAGRSESQQAIRGDRCLVPRLAPVAADDDRPSEPYDPERTVLITGAYGGLGARLAAHLVTRHGVRRLLLASRQGADHPRAAELSAELTGLGATVTLARCDTADPDDVAALLAAVPAEHPLTAVFHSAGVLDDGTLATVTPDRLHAVLRPKVDAGWHLHRLTLDLDLRSFVFFSSVAGTFGSAGQAAYAAANAFLDALAAHRRAGGRAATSLAWGPWAGPGMAGELSTADQRRITRTGIVPLTGNEGLRLLDAALAAGRPGPVPVRLETATLRRFANQGALPPVLSGLVRPNPRRSDQPAPGLVDRLRALPDGQRERHLLELLRAQIADVLGHSSPDTVDVGRGFLDLGFDSLSALELRNRLTAATGLRLTATVLFDHPTATAMARHLVAELHLGDPADAGDPDEAEIRSVLAAVPLRRLREAGLLDALRRLARDETTAPVADQPTADIATADVGDLIRMALPGADS